jgi:hypothetical protein
VADLTRDDRRRNRKHVLDGLKEETGSSGGGDASTRVDHYRADPVNASGAEFAFVGGLRLRRFYIDPTKPNGVERRSLWQNVTTRMGKPTAVDPGGWDGTTAVAQLQAIVEGAS